MTPIFHSDGVRAHGVADATSSPSRARPSRSLLRTRSQYAFRRERDTPSKSMTRMKVRVRLKFRRTSRQRAQQMILRQKAPMRSSSATYTATLMTATTKALLPVCRSYCSFSIQRRFRWHFLVQVGSLVQPVMHLALWWADGLVSTFLGTERATRNIGRMTLKVRNPGDASEASQSHAVRRSA